MSVSVGDIRVSVIGPLIVQIKRETHRRAIIALFVR